jgi:hypothetical protein
MHYRLIKQIIEPEIAQRLNEAELVRLSASQPTCEPPPMSPPPEPTVPTELVDEMIELYCGWRIGCAQVRAAYERLCDAPASDRTVAFAAYIAALDREQSACEDYSEQIRAIESHYAVTSSAPVLESTNRSR